MANPTGAGGRKRRVKKILKGVTHGRNGYAQGCGCTVCVTEEKQYQQFAKAKRNGCVPSGMTFRTWQANADKSDTEDIATVTQLHSVPTDESEDDVKFDGGEEEWVNKPRHKGTLGRERRANGAKAADKEPGPHEQAVIDECANLSLAQERPAMVMAARNAAKIMDTPKQAALHTQASRQMVSILNDLRGSSKKKSGGRLAKVQSMTRPTTVAR